MQILFFGDLNDLNISISDVEMTYVRRMIETNG